MRFLAPLAPLALALAACACAPSAEDPEVDGEGEGEGEPGEGEGEAGEGEGEPSEGEGEAGEGEGESGEGEGEGGEGEGEGTPPDSALELRSVDEVCGAWRAYAFSSEPDWVPLGDGTDTCDVGAMPDASQDAAIARVNLYRWLAGLPPVALAPQLVQQQQACANVLAGLGHLDHAPPQDTPCFTPEGAGGAGSSNLAQGASAAMSVDLFVGDSGVFSMGHRRWVLNPSADVTAFGFKNAFTCMYSFAQGASADPDFVSWPPPGPVPSDAAYGRFSFATSRHAATSETIIEVSVDGGAFEAVEHDDLGWGYGSLYTTLAFDVPGGLMPWDLGGHTTRVRISGLALPSGALDADPVEYESRFVACP